ncbi:MAG: response regulator transcription factor [Gemmatimonadetes bacterium]|uniref:Phosphate regulon transcriptional regulatory protein PhoB n=1 Tax=Candidatus Kutchimonas denitrificans TaxID=3056748 RepID=A0AAE4Z612_9BACT|nr:response regulator transcription factor [Gemmatimonadota bacterium]NIR74409.1 response regulator transcription factor [Candidatus Kutchimonas denitrificans]NIS02660.1 response regulator transcription factor [Gemmatimonadota bacterium]NIT68535.1 response regulator transcription factor [Gemmatimonadota bacterium]NIU52012.1 response regulator [Gemmatimonadota bacterium]
MAKKRILVVEDNTDLAYGLRNNLEIEGYDVEVAADGKAGLERALAREHDLVVLDLMLPRLDGYHVLRRLRQEGVETPVLILTARGEEADKVQGFRLGADQYVTKPFGLLELLARVGRLLDREGTGGNGGADVENTVRFGDIEVDSAARRVRRAGEDVTLTPKEYELLAALIRRHGQAVSRQDLLREVWGYPSMVVSRTVDTHVAELRRKLEADPSRPRYIVTVRKIGYRLESDIR